MVTKCCMSHTGENYMILSWSGFTLKSGSKYGSNTSAVSMLSVGRNYNVHGLMHSHSVVFNINQS